eukprot:scaffold952_cov249-Pinguiococcus_pyrenoidosus.AAC.1
MVQWLNAGKPLPFAPNLWSSRLKRAFRRSDSTRAGADLTLPSPGEQHSAAGLKLHSAKGPSENRYMWRMLI